MKALYTSDLHGQIHLYQELMLLATSSLVEIIALGGDLLPSFPPTKRYEDMVPNQKAFIDQFLLPFFKRVVDTTSVKQILLIPGNWDLGYSHLFEESKGWIVDLNQRIHQFENGYEFIGYPFVPPTPFRPKDYEKMDDRDAPLPPQKNPSYVRSSDQSDQLKPVDPYHYLRERETILEDLNQLPKPQSPKKTVYIMHSPPFGTRLDLVQGGKSAGSRSIKSFIEKNQPLFTLHGHIHESPDLSCAYFDRIGETLSINPGQFIWKKLHAIIFEMENVEATLTHTCFPRVRSGEFGVRS